MLRAIILIALFFIIVLIRSVIISPISEPSLNETILAESRIWGTRVKLVPRVFAFESSSYDVKVKLRGAGFRLEKNKKVWTKYKFEEGLGRKIYTRRIHYNGSCKVTAYVFIEFSNNQQLIFAEGTVDEYGCI